MRTCQNLPLDTIQEDNSKNWGYLKHDYALGLEYIRVYYTSIRVYYNRVYYTRIHEYIMQERRSSYFCQVLLGR